jgi:hypothetical protein
VSAEAAAAALAHLRGRDPEWDLGLEVARPGQGDPERYPIDWAVALMPRGRPDLAARMPVIIRLHVQAFDPRPPPEISRYVCDVAEPGGAYVHRRAYGRWDPRTGTFRRGRHWDEAPGRWRWQEPYRWALRSDVSQRSWLLCAYTDAHLHPDAEVRRVLTLFDRMAS